MHVRKLAQPPSPLELACRLAPLPGCAWLDGEAAHRDGRYSFLGAAPCEQLEVSLAVAKPLRALERLEPSAAIDADEAGELAAHGLLASEVPAWIGYLAYDACLWPAVRRIARDPTRPALAFARYDALFVLDHARGLGFIVGDDAEACERLQRRAEAGPRTLSPARCFGLQVTPAEQHHAAITRALEHIARGDLYQVNLARCFRARFEGAPLALFAAMRAASPVPFGFYLEHRGGAVLSRTMERFLRWDRTTRVLCTRPIKGTIARHGRDIEEAAALRGDEKERAEHTMIVDLMRNDFGRVAELGSVSVEALLAVEPYAKLSHLCSTVVCRTQRSARIREVLGATFPPGSVTGAPKLRAIELIEQLETVPRDVYTGALGFVDRAGGLSLAVAIRSAVVRAGEVRYFAGGGIVEASQSECELAETELKARVFLDALAELAPHAIPLDLSRTEVLR